MAVKDYKTNPDENTTISGINIAEGCAPSGINNAIRQLMADVKSDHDAQAESIEKAATTIMTGATASAQGTSGNVPAPRAGDQNKPLTGGGTYANSIDCAASSLSSMFLDYIEDTPDWWRSKGTSIFAVNHIGMINHQPAQYGTIINTVVGVELEQIFIVHPDGKDFYTRGANFDGWNGNANDSGTWHKISNSMPVGSVYVQFSGQSEPAALFGGTWSNISWMYAGLFFRAEGGASAPFGSTQNDAAPNINGWATQIETYKTRDAGGAFLYRDQVTNNNIGSGSNFGSAGLEFWASNSNAKFGSAEEIRPINSTIRVWKRTA